MVDQRPSPDQLLARSQDEELRQRRGKLKIYLGASPGVGKTYTMLHDALARRTEDLDVVIGVAESHGREDINQLLTKFEILPRKKVRYRGTVFSEFDLEASLQRNPGLILIDEMAHSNAPRLRHEKRWQDIKELLDRGIDVYTTLNVQHIESLKDDVAQIIEAPIRETVPDFMIELANTIELVDLPPEELLKRLQEGKIYIPRQAQLATEHFFRKGNLIALRELALRVTAERVGTDVLLYRQNEGIKQIWPTRDKFLVCVGSRPDSLKLIRAAKRIVSSLQGEWLAVYVDSPRLKVSSSTRNKAIQNLRLAEQLGAEIHVLTGFDIVKVILDFAREQNVTQIMIRKHIYKRWQAWFKRNLTDEIVRHSGEIDVYIMTAESVETLPKEPEFIKPIPWKKYIYAMGIISAATVFNFILFPLTSASNLVMVYLLGITMIAGFGQFGLSIFASITSVLAYEFFFVPPFMNFAFNDFQNIFTLMVMLLVAQVISYLTILTRRQAETSRIIQQQTSALYTLSRRLSNTRGVEDLILFSAHYISTTFNAEVMILLPNKIELEIRCSFPENQRLDMKERSIAQWVFEMGQRAGFSTETLSFSKALYLPLLVAQAPIGVIRIQPGPMHILLPEQMDLLESCVHQVALALDVDRMQENTRKKELKIKTDRARITLLEAISNDLDFPLKKIDKAAASFKKEERSSTNHATKEIDYELEKLNRLNKNIARIIQLEFQEVKLKKTMNSLTKVIDVVLKNASLGLKDREIHKNIPKHLPDIPFNKALIQEVLTNLIDNVMKYTPPKSPITISIYNEEDRYLVSVEDSGPGVAIDERDKLFEKFYRGKQAMTVHGLGLGLAICHQIIEAHGGKMWVENIEHKGAAFFFTLPVGGE